MDGSGSSDNIEITAYSWDFDASDGVQEEATGVDASHVYTTGGTYTVTLTVRDGAGNTDWDTLEVIVEEPPTQPTANVDVIMSREDIGRGPWLWSRATATVTVLVDGAPLKEATVHGSWSGAYEDKVVGMTTGEGTITFRSKWVKQAGIFTFTVDSVEKDGVNYILTGKMSDSR